MKPKFSQHMHAHHVPYKERDLLRTVLLSPVRPVVAYTVLAFSFFYAAGTVLHGAAAYISTVDYVERVASLYGPKGAVPAVLGAQRGESGVPNFVLPVPASRLDYSSLDK